MQIVSLDDLHEMTSPIFLKKKKTRIVYNMSY